MKGKIVSLVGSFRGFPRILREILYSMSIHEMDLGLRKERDLTNFGSMDI
jgi:hypothetical protein